MTPTADKVGNVQSMSCVHTKEGTIDWTGRCTGRSGTGRDRTPGVGLPSTHPSVRVLRAGGLGLGTAQGETDLLQPR